LHVVQVGAQNHNNTGWPAYAAMSIVPPPTRGAENASDCGTAGGVGVGADVGAGEGAAVAGGAANGSAGCTSGLPHAASAATPTAHNNIRRTGRTLTALA